MSRPNIYAQAASFLNQPMPVLVFHRGIFDSTAPIIGKIWSRTFDLPKAIIIAANACTYNLTPEASFSIHCDRTFTAAVARLRRLETVKVLDISCSRSPSIHLRMSDVFVELKRFALTLTVLDIKYSSLVHHDDVDMKVLADSVATLRNLKNLTVPLLTPKLCEALVAGPGKGLNHLLVEKVECQPADFDDLVAGCQNIVTVHGLVGFNYIDAASKLPYLQSLKCNLYQPLAVADMRTSMSNMKCLTKLDLWLDNDSPDTVPATIAATIGSQLIQLKLYGPRLRPEPFATICCASSFPQLEVLKLSSYANSVIDDDVTVSLSPSLEQLSLPLFSIAPRTLTQLLTDKPQLEHLDLELDKSRRRGRNDNNSNNDANQPAVDDEDWFGELVKTPLQTLLLVGGVAAHRMDTRIGQLASTLTAASIDVPEWPDLVRDGFLGVMCSQCARLNYIFVRFPNDLHAAELAFTHSVHWSVADRPLAWGKERRTIERG